MDLLMSRAWAVFCVKCRSHKYKGRFTGSRLSRCMCCGAACLLEVADLLPGPRAQVAVDQLRHLVHLV